MDEAGDRFRELIERSRDILYRYRLKPTPGFEFVSPAATTITGYTPEEHYADPDLGRKLVHPDDLPIFEAAISSPSAEPITLRWVRKDGRVIWTEQLNVPVLGEAGELVAIEGIARDITERREAEQALRETETRYRTLVEQIFDLTERRQTEEVTRETASLLEATLDSTADGILVVDLEGKWSTFNKRFAEMWRIPERLLQARDDQQALAFVLEQLKDPDAFLQKVMELYAQPEVESFDVIEFKDGRVLERYSAPQRLDRKPIGRVWSFRDVTERRRAELELQEAETQYRALVERLPAIVYVAVFGESAPWLYVSPAIEKVLGVTPEEWKADEANWLKHIHPDDRERAMAEEERSRRTGEILGSEYRMVAGDGRIVWIRDEAEVVLGEDGSPSLLRGLMYDITEAKRTEEALARSEAEVRRLLARLVEAQEEERARIARDIHDDSIQVVTAVGLRLEAFRRRLRHPEELEGLDKLEETTAAAIGRLRNLLFELRPRALDEEGLAAALGLYVHQVGEQTGLQCRLENRLVGEPPLEIRTVLYRIAQEALVNVRKHAGAACVEVLLEEREGGFFVRIKDDGAGFVWDETEMGTPGHLGLSSMRERAEMAGGWWRMDSRPGVGTTVEFWLPGGVQASAAQSDA